MNTSTAQFPIARKNHCCSWCGGTIQIGESYRKQTMFSDGSAYTWKNHRSCDELTTRLKMFENHDYGEGLSQSDFADCITEEFVNIMYDAGAAPFSRTNKLPEFKERMKIVREHHSI
jgi:hypothetical protein